MTPKTEKKRLEQDQNPASPANVEANGGDPWVSVQLDRPIYKPAVCGKTPLVGYLLARETLPDGFNGQPWVAYSFRLTMPTLAVGFGAKEATTFPAGTEVLLPEGVRIRSLASRLHPKVLVELRIVVSENRTEKGAWAYTVTANRQSVIQRPADLLAHVSLPASSVPALPPHQAPHDDLPF